MNRQDVIDHLQIIRTWAAVGKDSIYHGIEPKCCEKVEKWIDDALALLKDQEDMIPIHTVADWLAGYAAPPGLLPTSVYNRAHISALWMKFLGQFKEGEK